MTYPAPEPEIVRIIDWYDGPLAGLCQMGGVALWFVLDDDVCALGDRRRVHNLYRANNPEQARIEYDDGSGNFPPPGEFVGVWYEGAGVVPASCPVAAGAEEEG